jgi:GntR family transcriptional regulator
MSSKHPIARLNRTKKKPLHQQAEEQLRELIAMPKYRKGALLPEEVGLAAQLGISRHTLRQAIGRLVSEGLLVRTAGVGTRVSNQPVHTNVSAWSSFTREMQRIGIEVENFEIHLSRVKPSKEVAERFGVDPETLVWRLFRVRGWNDQPVVVADSWLHPRLGLTGREDFSRPLYESLKHASGIQPARSSEEISVAPADEATAEKLAVEPGSPLLLRKRLVFDAQGEPIEFNFNSYRPEAYVLNLELEVKSQR